ncbi:MAG: alanine racemase [Bryobacteraceae bacterium]|nr:alanine racemase [Bryobacteraceae bacterium]MDW8379059.1 alanine racemase [Bryobacterales bacterium]
MRISELETPAVVIDLDIMERNLKRVAGYAKSYDLRLRPHTKTHKIPALGRLQLEHGAIGLTVAKVGEAEVMAQSGTPDLLVAYPVIGRKKLDRLMEVAKKTRLTVSLDSLFAARQLSDAARSARVPVSVLAEADVGMGRVGVTPGEELNELGRQIARLPYLNLEGIAFYPGHIRTAQGEGAEELAELASLVQWMISEWKRAALPLNVVSGGSTPLLWQSHQIPGMNEIRPGTYIFNDKNVWLASQACQLDDCAASVLVTVVSTARPRQVIIDGGSKTFSSDRLAGTSEMSFGYVVDAPEAVFFKMNEEHGYIDLKRTECEFAVGDRLRIIPNHICVVMNLHEHVYGVRGGEVVEIWKVEGRGKLQ